MEDQDGIYHGYSSFQEGPASSPWRPRTGEQIRLLRHYVKRSPGGFQWGYIGSGPAETARCLLLDAAGDPTG